MTYFDKDTTSSDILTEQLCCKINLWNIARGVNRLTSVLTSDNIMRSLRASVSPPFILILFLSRHFIAYLNAQHH